MKTDSSNFDFKDIPDAKIMSHPLVQELSQAVKIKDFKLPLVLKDKTLMEEGNWNNHFYSLDSIVYALNNTDWSDRNNSDLFLDHKDTEASEWIGTVENKKMFGRKLLGDLVIYDLNTAVKLQLGKPKIGISPKVLGKNNIRTNEVSNFRFGNFSVVYNPAVKTAYLNNSETNSKTPDVSKEIIIENESADVTKENDKINTEQDLREVTDFEALRKKMDLTVSEFYAIPKDPPSASKLPIFDISHVRNALARINQVKDVSTDELVKAKSKIEAAAKKFGIKVDGGKNMSEEKEKELNEVVTPETEAKGQPDEGSSSKAEAETEKKAQTQEETKEEVKKEEEKTETKTEETGELSELDGKIGFLKTMLGELETKKEALQPKGSELSEVSAKLSSLESKFESVVNLVEKQASVAARREAIPDKRSVNAPAPLQDDAFKAELASMKKDPDTAMHKLLSKFATEGGVAE